MSWYIFRPIGANGAWAPGVEGSNLPTVGWSVIRSPSGPQGPAAATNFAFDYPGLLVIGEPNQNYFAAEAWTISQAACGGFATAGPTADLTFTLEGDIGSGFMTIATAVFRAASLSPWAPTITVAIAEGPAATRFRHRAPQGGDATFAGGTVTYASAG